MRTDSARWRKVVREGYDAISHTQYADFLIQHLRLPFRNETPEYYSPPLYYVVAGGLTWLGRQAGLENISDHQRLRARIFQHPPDLSLENRRVLQ